MLVPEIADIFIFSSSNAFITPKLLSAFVPPPVQAKPIVFILRLLL